MTAPANILQQLLGPWMTGASPSAIDTSFAPYGGTQGLLSAMMQADTPANYGRALQGAQAQALQNAAARQQLAQGSIGLQRSMMMLPITQAYYRAAMGGSPTDTGTSQAPESSSTPAEASSAGAASPATAVTDFGQPRGGAQPAAIAAPNVGPSLRSPASAVPYWLRPPSPQDIAATPVAGMSAQMLRLGGILNGKSPLETAQSIRQQQLALAQQQYGQALAQLDTLTKSDVPTRYVAADPQLTAAWQQLAPRFGFDPAKDFTDSNVRTAFTFARNRLAGALSEPTVAPAIPLQTITLPDGRKAQVDPVSGKVTPIAPSPLEKVVGPNGPTLVPTAKAGGMTPYNQQTFVDTSSVDGMARMIADYKMAPLTGFALRSPQGQAIMARVQELNPSYDSTQFTTKNRARQQFATGKQGDTVRSLSVATDHLDQLAQAADALQNGDTRIANRIINAFATGTGNPKVTNFDAMKQIVSDEVVKAMVGTGGAESDRDAIRLSFEAANSPAQLEGVIEKYKGLLGGQLNGLRRQYERSTGLKDFDSMVSPSAETQLSGARNRSLGQGASSGALSDDALLKKWGGQ